MKIQTLSVDQARKLDTRAESEFGIPLLLLMENAGIGLAGYIRQYMIPPINRCRVAMICGTGNKAGDAFVAARHLYQTGILCDVFLVGEEPRMKEEAAINFRIIKNLGIPCKPIGEFEKETQRWSFVPVLIIDALLGTGFKAPLREPFLSAVRRINKFKKLHNCSVKVVAVDLPSGLDGDEGPLNEDVVRADLTVTFACLKKGMSKPEARAFVGRAEVVDIGIPEKLF